MELYRCSAYRAEFQGILIGLQEVRSRNWIKIQIQIDNRVVVQAIQHLRIANLKHRNLISCIYSLLD